MSAYRLLRDVSLASLFGALFPPLAFSQQELPRIDVGAARHTTARAARHHGVAAPMRAPAPTPLDGSAPGFSNDRAILPVYRDPPGQTVTTVDHKFLRTTPMFTVQEALQYSPGVAVQYGNFAREVNISIRGSGSRFGVGFPLGVRNIMMYEDGFPIVTADGAGRTDMLDPHAYGGVDVYRGPSSALFGNYAYGGAINFRSLTGADIDGVETGSEFGSYGYINNYVRIGKKLATKEAGEFDISLFGSDARGDGYLAHSAYSGDQVRLLAKWTPTPSDRFTLKFVFNDTFAQFMNRLSFNQYYWNPYGKDYGCAYATPQNLPVCNNLNVPANGVFTSLRAPLLNQSVSQLGSHIHTQRDVSGFRWEHDFDKETTWRTQFTYDYFDYINGTWPPPKVGPAVFGGLGGPVTIRGPSVGIDATTDVTSRAPLFSLPATHYLGFFYNNAKATNPLFNQLPNMWGYGAAGGIVGVVESFHSNIGLRAREEIALTPQLTAALGFSSNWNKIWGVNEVLNYGANGGVSTLQQVVVDKAYWNTAPEASLTYRYSPEWQLRARYGAGYGTPAFQFLTTTQTGAGNNSSLQAQTNMGVDLGVDWTPAKNVTVSLTGFHEWFRNEILTLSNGLVSYQTNVPASIHRGVEANIDWRPIEGWRFVAAYTLNNQFFANYWDNLGAVGGTFVYYNRSGNRIPNVSPHTLTARVGYDQPTGDFKGLGAYAEYVFKAGYTIDNANFTTVPGYGLVNLNVHYNRDIAGEYFKNIELYLNMNNVFDRNYIAGSFVMSNTLIAGTTIQTPGVLLSTAQGAGIIAGPPRTLVGGVKLKF